MRDLAINALVNYAIRTELIHPCEYNWAINTILDVLKLDGYTSPDDELEGDLHHILEVLLDDAHQRGILPENSVKHSTPCLISMFWRPLSIISAVPI